jgi:ribosomal protein S18 acetylase RimI-like enzyme
VLLKAWADGWSVVRRTPAPVEVAEGYRIDVGLPDHVTRYVLPAHVPALAARLTEPGTWLKICAADVVLDSRWEVQPPEYLMSARLGSEPPAVAPEYGLQIGASDGVIEVLVTHLGEPAARGKAAVVGEHAVMDQVVTEPAHRRRGLGSTVMGALCAAATSRGATTGVLVATADGRMLYSRLGWTVASPVTAARLRAVDGPGERREG